jgi:hypothetical protein
MLYGVVEAIHLLLSLHVDIQFLHMSANCQSIGSAAENYAMLCVPSL